MCVCVCVSEPALDSEGAARGEHMDSSLVLCFGGSFYLLSFKEEERSSSFTDKYSDNGLPVYLMATLAT